MTVALLLVLLLVTGLGVLIGVRDAPNAVALAVRYRALTPRAALALAATLNAVGVVLGALVPALALGTAPAVSERSPATLLVVGVAAAVGIAWGVLLWRRRIPASTTHALLAALAGGHLATGSAPGTALDPALHQEFGTEVLLSLAISPLLAWGIARLLAPAVVRIGTTGATVNVQHRARVSLAVSTGLSSLGHGVQAAQRLCVLWLLALAAGGWPGALTPTSTVVAAAVFAVAVGAGTLGGGWRIARTLTERLVVLDPLRAAVAAAVPAALLFVGSFLLHLPLSSSHTVTAGIVGAGQTQSFASVRWPTVLSVLAWWVATPLVCGAAAYGLTMLILPVAA